MPDELRRTDLNRFYENVGAHYDEEKIVYRDLRGKLRKKFVLSFIKQAGGKFLDLGCNTGIYCENFAGELVVGIDLSGSVLKNARTRCATGKNSRKQLFIKASIEHLDFLQHVSFDFILCSEVLEHLFHPEKVFQGIARLLSPGGKALITTPNYKKQKPTWVKLGELKSAVSGDEYFHTAFRPEELAEFATLVDLKIIEAGTLEWEVKYAAKIPALFFVVFRFFNKPFGKRRFEQINQRFFERFTLFIYYICHYSRLENLLKRFIREGVRSYILVTK